MRLKSMMLKVISNLKMSVLNIEKAMIMFSKIFFSKIKIGEYVALVGPSGAGKTTLCSLIPRFYEVNAGEILLDDVDIRKIKMQNLRKHIGFVQQDVYLFAGTVIENIRYGKPSASDEEIILLQKKLMRMTLLWLCQMATIQISVNVA